jgi:branched-chain amino acid transport system ATP-binding protein
MLEVKNLSGGWGPTVVNENVSLTVAAGESVAIIGRNGVGKSTLLELITGRAERRGGTVRLDGSDISRLPTHRRARLGLGYVPQHREVFPSLSVKEHLQIAARPGRWTEESVLNLLPSLRSRWSSSGAHLSGGEQQMLAIARALIANPRVILMDEPSEGLAPVVVEQLVEAMRQVVGDGSLSLLLVEQRVDIALDLSSRCLVMDRGAVVHEGTGEEFRRGELDIAELMGLGDERAPAPADTASSDSGSGN